MRGGWLGLILCSNLDSKAWVLAVDQEAMHVTVMTAALLKGLTLTFGDLITRCITIVQDRCMVCAG